ncbi:CdaR family protein [Paenibacillus marinisediminis]
MDKWLLNNTSTKIIALVLGVLLFIVVHKEDASTVATQPTMVTKWINSVAVQTVGLDPETMHIRSMSSETIRIQVRGKKATLETTQPADYKVVLDLTGYGEGRHVIPLKFEVPDNIEMIQMSPSMVTVELESVQTQQFEVQAKTEGTPEVGYTAGTPIIRPTNRVHVTLPTTRMNEVKSVSAVVKIDKANTSVIQKQAKLTAYDAAGREMKDAVITPSVVEVEIPITKPFKSVPLQINQRGSLPAGLSVASIEPSVNTVTLYGATKELEKIDIYDSVQVNTSDFTAAGEYTVNVKLTPPPNIEKIEPSEIAVKVTIAADVQRVIKDVPITLTGESDRLITSITEPASRKYDVTVIGAPNVVENLTAKDVQLIANVNDLPPGTHQVALQVNLPRFVKLVDPAGYQVVIFIQEKEQPAVTPPEPNPDPGSETTPPEDSSTNVDHGGEAPKENEHEVTSKG